MFLTESDREQNDALPVVIDSGKEEERDQDFLPEHSHCFGLVAEFQFSHCHPGFDVISTLLHGEDETWDFMKGAAFWN